MAITTLAAAFDELRKSIDAYENAKDGPSGDTEHEAANELADAAELVLALADQGLPRADTASTVAVLSGVVAENEVEEIVPLVIDDDDAAYVHDVFWTEKDALAELRRYLVGRFGEDTVAEAEADEGKGLSSLVDFKTESFALPMRRG